MKENERKGDVGDDLVDFLHRLAGLLGKHAGKRAPPLIAAIDDKPGNDRRRCSKTRSATTMQPPPGLWPR